MMYSKDDVKRALTNKHTCIKCLWMSNIIFDNIVTGEADEHMSCGNILREDIDNEEIIKVGMSGKCEGFTLKIGRVP